MVQISTSLDEIAQRFGPTPELRVPPWTLGTVRRRSITFATGVEDSQTFVVWVQSQSMTGDLRILPARPRLGPSDRLEDLDHKSMILLASVEGGIAATSWQDGVMSWQGWIGFQAYDKYPEPGLLQRVGPCMVEVAPSGIYVEDWRFQASAMGPLAGLRLLSETSAGGETYQRAGGVVRAGDHAIVTLGRRAELPEGTRAQDFVAAAHDPVAALKRVFDCSVDYVRFDDDAPTVYASTDPRREGEACTFFDRLSPGPSSDIVIEAVDDEAGVTQRAWRIESLELDYAFPLFTEVPADRLDWLERESDTLLASLDSLSERIAPCA